MTSMKKSRLLLSITIVFFWASEYCHTPYFTPYLQTLGFTAELIGIMTGFYGFTQMIVRIPLGIATDATGWYKKTIIMGTVFTTVSSFGLIFATDFLTIVICRILAGIAASTWLAFTVLYAGYFEAEHSVGAMTNVNVFNNTGKLLAFVLGLWSASLWGYRVPLVCSFVTGLIAVGFALFLKPVPMKRESFHLNQVVEVFRSPGVIVASVFGILMMLFMHGTVFSFTSAAGRSLGGSAFEIGLASVIFTLAQVLLVKPIKNFLRGKTAGRAVSSGFVLLAISAFCVVLAKGMLGIYLAQILAGIGNLILSSSLMAIIVKTISQEKQSTAMGLYQAVYGFGMTLGPVLTGKIFESTGGYVVAYGFLTALMLTSALATVWLFKKYAIK